MFFDGVDDFIGTNLDMSWNQTNNVTIQILLRPNSINGSTKGILGKENPNWEWSFYQSSVNTCLVYWNTGGGHTNVMDNCWYLSASPSKDSLLTYTWDMSTSRFYLNNQLVTTHVATNPTINQDRTNGLQIGGHIYTWGDSYFNGIIDEIRIYKRTLSQYEVQQQAKAL